MVPLDRAGLDALVFDAYGTLLDTVSASRRHAARIGPEWEAFSTLWRTKQFEYTWVRSLVAGQYVEFWRVVDDALRYAAAAYGITDATLLDDLRDSFDWLDLFPEVRDAMETFAAAGLRLAVLSNGTPAMLTHTFRELRLEERFDSLVSVEEVGVYKPHARVYARAVERLGVPTPRIGFVSSNPWDVFGAHVFGLRAIWLNRAGGPDEYRLRGVVPEVANLVALQALLD